MGKAVKLVKAIVKLSIFFTAVDAGVPLLGFWGREGDAIDPRLEDEGWMNVYQGVSMRKHV